MGYTGRLKDTNKRHNKGKKCVVEPNTFTDASMKANGSSIVLTPLKTETLRHGVDAIPQVTTTSQLYQVFLQMITDIKASYNGLVYIQYMIQLQHPVPASSGGSSPILSPSHHCGAILPRHFYSSFPPLWSLIPRF
ncbi:hypothetical protein Trisim1_006055 [Trichoderma cf. simile WF8]